MKQKIRFTLSDLRIAAYQVWGAGVAEKMVRLAINSGQVVLAGLPHPMNSTTKARSL
jgi:hypothetical protein